MCTCPQAIYGVADSSLYWSPATGKGWSFVWGVGQTPFGVLSNMHSLSFVQRDAAVRNMALSYLNNSMAHAALLIQGYQWISPYDGDMQHVKTFLRPDQVGFAAGVCLPHNPRRGCGMITFVVLSWVRGVGVWCRIVRNMDSQPQLLGTSLQGVQAGS